MNGQPKQMTKHETMRASWLFMHPRADGLPHIEGITHWMPLPAEPKEGK